MLCVAQQSALPDMNSFSRGSSKQVSVANAFEFDAATAAAAAAAGAGTANLFYSSPLYYQAPQQLQQLQQFVQPYAQSYPTAMFITPPDPRCASAARHTDILTLISVHILVRFLRLSYSMLCTCLRSSSVSANAAAATALPPSVQLVPGAYGAYMRAPAMYATGVGVGDQTASFLLSPATHEYALRTP